MFLFKCQRNSGDISVFVYRVARLYQGAATQEKLLQVLEKERFKNIFLTKVTQAVPPFKLIVIKMLSVAFTQQGCYRRKLKVFQLKKN